MHAVDFEFFMLTLKQTGVLKGMLTGLAITIASLAAAIALAPSALLPAPAASHLTHALRYELAVLACLAINIGLLARHRFFTPDDIDGGGLSRGTAHAQLLQATLQNTLEQVVLAVGVHLVWAASMPREAQAAVPVAVALFTAGRLLFWLGYAHGAPARSLGFSLTFYPSLTMLLIAAVHALAFG